MAITSYPVTVISRFPATVAVFSRSLRRALNSCASDLGRVSARLFGVVRKALSQFSLWIWVSYLRSELRLAALLSDLILAWYAARFLVLLVAVGVGLGWWRQWLFLGLYVALLVVALFRSGIEGAEIAEAQSSHRNARARLIPFLRWSLRLATASLAPAVFLYKYHQTYGGSSGNALVGLASTIESVRSALPSLPDVSVFASTLRDTAGSVLHTLWLWYWNDPGTWYGLAFQIVFQVIVNLSFIMILWFLCVCLRVFADEAINMVKRSERFQPSPIGPGVASGPPVAGRPRAAK
jgi:hypothetical protein